TARSKYCARRCTQHSTEASRLKQRSSQRHERSPDAPHCNRTMWVDSAASGSIACRVTNIGEVMMRRIGLLVYAIALCFGIPAAAQGHWREIGDVTRVEKLTNGVLLTADQARMSVTVINSGDAVRVRAIGSGVF